VSDLDSTQQAFKTYQQHKATQRPLITPNTLRPSPLRPSTEENQS
jgi:hypothetical protein